jgi:hypothetical protein
MPEKEMTMIERCAKAIYAKLNDEMRGDGYLSDISDDMTDVVVDGRVDLLAVAKAVIEEMREPTEAMVEAGGEAYYGHPRASAVEWAKEDKFDLHAADAAIFYAAMVNAALKEQEGDDQPGGRDVP